MDRRTFLTMMVAVPAVAQRKNAPAPKKAPPPVPPPVPRGLAWTQWGGPHRNFKTDATGLKDTWPSSGPRIVWKRALGEGYSSSDIPTLVEGTLPQHRVTKLSPRPAGPDDLAQLFEQALVAW